jgi:type I restriction enzyme S subunit
MKRRWNITNFAEGPLEIIDGDRGKNYPQHTDFSDVGFCVFLNAGNVSESGFSFSNVQFIEQAKDDKLRKGKLKRDDVVMTTRGTIGNVGHYAQSIPFEHMRINSGMVIFRCDLNRLLPQYLYHFLRTPYFYGQMNSLRSGVAQPQLPIRDIKRIELPLPSLTEQSRIAEHISAYDELLENNRRRMGLLEEAARLVYREWFVRLRFPGHEHARLTNGCPQGWEEGTIANYYDTTSGGTPSRSNPDFYTGEINWVKTQELNDDFIFETQEQITEAAIEKSSAKIFPENTVLVSIYGGTNIGRTGILAQPAATNQACCALFPKDPRAHYIFTALYFRENREKLLSLAQGAAQTNISQQVIRSLQILFPTMSIASLFVEALKPVFEQRKNLHRQNQKLRAARDLLLPRLMSGEITV